MTGPFIPSPFVYGPLEDNTSIQGTVRAQRPPTVNDKYSVGTRWDDQLNVQVYELAAYVGGVPQWILLGSSSSGLNTLSAEGGAPFLPVANNFDFSGATSGAVIFSTPANGLMEAAVQVDGTTIVINGSNQLAAANKLSGTITTSDGLGQTRTIIVLPMGAVPAVFTCEARLAAFNTTDTIGAGYFLIGAARATGAAAIEIDQEVADQLEEAGMTGAIAQFVAVGNTFEIQVTGIATKVINWSCEMEYETVT